MTATSVPVVGQQSDSIPSAISALSAGDLTDLLYPVGSVVTFSAPQFFFPLSGVNAPEFAPANWEFGVGFSDSTLETVGCRLDTLIPDTWRTVNIYLSFFNFLSATGNVKIRVVDDTPSTTDTTVSVPLMSSTADIKIARVVSDLSVYNSSFPLVGSARKNGGMLKISRVVSGVSSNLSGDLYVGSLFAERVT